MNYINVNHLVWLYDVVPWLPLCCIIIYSWTGGTCLDVTNAVGVWLPPYVFYLGLTCRGIIPQRLLTVWQISSERGTCRGEIITAGCTLKMTHSVRSTALRSDSAYHIQIYYWRSTWSGRNVSWMPSCFIIICTWTEGTCLIITHICHDCCSKMIANSILKEEMNGVSVENRRCLYKTYYVCIILTDLYLAWHSFRTFETKNKPCQQNKYVRVMLCTSGSLVKYFWFTVYNFLPTFTI